MIGLDFGTTNSCAAFAESYLGEVLTASVAPLNTPPYDAVLGSSVLDPLADNARLGVQAEEAHRALSPSDRASTPFLSNFKPDLNVARLRKQIRVIDETYRLLRRASTDRRRAAHVSRCLGGGRFSARAACRRCCAALGSTSRGRDRCGGHLDRAPPRNSCRVFKSRAQANGCSPLRHRSFPELPRDHRDDEVHPRARCGCCDGHARSGRSERPRVRDGLRPRWRNARPLDDRVRASFRIRFPRPCPRTRSAERRERGSGQGLRRGAEERVVCLGSRAQGAGISRGGAGASPRTGRKGATFDTRGGPAGGPRRRRRQALSPARNWRSPPPRC